MACKSHFIITLHALKYSTFCWAIMGMKLHCMLWKCPLQLKVSITGYLRFVFEKLPLTCSGFRFSWEEPLRTPSPRNYGLEFHLHMNVFFFYIFTMAAEDTFALTKGWPCSAQCPETAPCSVEARAPLPCGALSMSGSIQGTSRQRRMCVRRGENFCFTPQSLVGLISQGLQKKRDFRGAW